MSSRPQPDRLPQRTTARVLLSLLLLFVANSATAADKSVYASINSRLVKITGSGGLRGLPPYGTGAIISPEGHILTVWNHVLDERVVTITLPDGRKVDGQVLGADPELDVAVLKVDAGELPHFVLDDAVDVGTGTRVLAFSNMFRVAAGDEPHTVLHGVIAAKVKLQARKGVFEIPYKGPVYIVDAITNNSGAGGGVITTRDGRLVALIGREVRNAQTNTWINYSVPISAIRDVVADIQAGRVRRSTEEDEDVDGRTPRRFTASDFGIVLVPDVVPRTPAFVDRTIPGTPAAESGLRANDLVLFVNDELVPSCRALREELGRLKPGDPVRIVIRRGDELITLDWKTPDRDGT
jgi:serine protease Do